MPPHLHPGPAADGARYRGAACPSQGHGRRRPHLRGRSARPSCASALDLPGRPQPTLQPAVIVTYWPGPHLARAAAGPRWSRCAPVECKPLPPWPAAGCRPARRAGCVPCLLPWSEASRTLARASVLACGLTRADADALLRAGLVAAQVLSVAVCEPWTAWGAVGSREAREPDGRCGGALHAPCVRLPTRPLLHRGQNAH
jgi:hypothetical protein